MEPTAPEPPMSSEEALELGFRLHQAGRLKEAEHIYRELLKHNPEHTDALYLLGVLSYLLEKYSEGNALLEKVIECKPDFAEAHYNLANALRLQGRLDESVVCYQKTLEIKPDFANAHNNLGLALQALGRMEEAARCFHKAYTLNHELPGVALNQGNLLRQTGRSEEALEWYQKALDLNPEYVEALNSLGNALRDLGRQEEAEGHLKKVVEMKPDYALGHYNLGLVLNDQGKTGEAIEHYKKAVALKDDMAQAHNNLGNLLKDTGALEDAIFHYKKAHYLDPENVSAPYLLSVLQGKSHDSAPKAYVRELFDQYAPRFDEHLVDMLDYKTPELLCDLLKRNRRDSSLKFINALDLGCGTGLSGQVFQPMCDHLTGVDLSPGMIKLAYQKDCYDVLKENSLLEFLERSEDAFDLVIAADVLVYLGDLEPLFKALSKRVASGGAIVMSTEHFDGEAYQVQTSGRFAHAPDYVESCAFKAGLKLSAHESDFLRRSQDGKVEGDLFFFEKSPAG